MVRIKQRYILFEIHYPLEGDYEDPDQSLLAFHQPSPSTISAKSLLRTFRKSIEDNYGEVGAGSTGLQLQVKYFSNRTSTGIVRCPRGSYETLVGALATIDRLEAQTASVRCLHVSGTIRKCQEWSMAYNKGLMRKIGGNRMETPKMERG
ncbi:ribonuclease P/MRP protein subunit Pop5p [Diutina catenulata]